MKPKSTLKSTHVSNSHSVAWGFTTLSSADNPKAAKAAKYGYLNAILYMAPADSANGEFNLCIHAGACKALCLGEHSGQAAIGAPERNNAIRARKARAIAFMNFRDEFMAEIAVDVGRLNVVARRLGLILCYRFNGSTDIGYGVLRPLVDGFREVVFIDYTKNPNKMSQYLAGKFAPNYHVTFSYDPGTASVPSNERLCLRFLEQGGNVAVVFGEGRPETWHGYRVIDGDAHDVRVPALDGRGVVVGLTPKGRKAKRDTSGFVVRDYQMAA